MGVRVYAEIHIGGNLPLSKFKDFMEKVDYARRLVWTEKDFKSPQEATKWLKKELAEYDDGYVSVTAPDVNYGEFEDLEHYCRNNGLSYIRHNEGEAEFQPKMAWWFPGMKCPKEQITDSESNAIIKASELKHAIEVIKTFKPDEAPLNLSDDTRTDDQFFAQYSLKNGWDDPLEALKAWANHCYPEPCVNDLPKFQIV